MNDYLLDLPTWNEFSTIETDTVEEGDTSVEFDYAINKIRKTTSCSITRTPEEIVTYSPGNVASVRQAIGELISAADAAGHEAGSSIFFPS